MSDKDKKKDYPLGSRQNPVTRKGSNSQAGLQAHKNRRGGPKQPKKKR